MSVWQDTLFDQGQIGTLAGVTAPPEKTAGTPPASPFAVSREERRAQLSRHLIPVVEKLAADGQAYGDLSVEQIIKAGGISRSAFYNYFDDKIDLLAAMAGDAVADVVASGDSWWELPHDGSKADMRARIRVPFDSYLRAHVIFGAIVEVSTYDERVRAHQHWLMDQVSSGLAAHLAEAQARGSADDSLDPERTAKWIVWMLERGLYQLVHPADPDEIERLLDAATDIIWNTLYARSRTNTD
jgi:AcrR family transcriptional regulator